jgi:phosphoribosylformimino-5-aminoimidazole carboxamide ribotide isomerase
MDLFPAIDLLGGHAVRLVQGDFEREQRYGDPFELADRFVAAGAPWIHVVDLDAARSGDPVNRELVVAITKRVPIDVQTGGGVRSEADVAELLEAGVKRVVLGTAAIDDPELARRCATRFPGQVALGLDYRRRPDGTLEAARRGWVEGSDRGVLELLVQCAGFGLAAVVVTAIDRDGTLGGPDLEGLAEVLDATRIAVVASGGVGRVEDLSALRELRSSTSGRRAAGVVVGKALLDGRIGLEEAVAACEASG